MCRLNNEERRDENYGYDERTSFSMVQRLEDQTRVVKHLRIYYFLTTFDGIDLTHFATICRDLPMMKMSCG